MYESESGHALEFDDTKGAERVHVYHRSGSYTEWAPDGSRSERIQKDNFFTDEFVYIKIPRNVYHEQLLNGSFQLALVDGSRKLFLADVSKYNSVYDEPSLAYLVSASNQNDIKYVSGNLDIYGLIDRKNALAIIDVPKLNNIFGNNMFVTESFKTQIKSFKSLSKYLSKNL